MSGSWSTWRVFSPTLSPRMRKLTLSAMVALLAAPVSCGRAVSTAPDDGAFMSVEVTDVFLSRAWSSFGAEIRARVRNLHDQTLYTAGTPLPDATIVPGEALGVRVSRLVDGVWQEVETAPVQSPVELIPVLKSKDYVASASVRAVPGSYRVCVYVDFVSGVREASAARPSGCSSSFVIQN